MYEMYVKLFGRQFVNCWLLSANVSPSASQWMLKLLLLSADAVLC